MQTPLWQPGPERIAGTRITEFMKRCGKADYQTLYDWSIDDLAGFWRAVWDFTEVIGDRGELVLADPHGMPGVDWFPDARLNFAENLLRRRDDTPAIILHREDGFRRELSFRQLHAEVIQLRGAFRAAGLKPGDRVAAFIPNIPEGVICMLAVASLGGVWASASQDFGSSGVIDRFGQIEPRFLLVADAYLYKGRSYPSDAKLRDVSAGLPTVEKTIIIPYVEETPWLDVAPNSVNYRDFLNSAPADDSPFERFSFEHPLYILFSSGTTGKPKCITHGAGGTLLQHLKEHQLHTDIGPSDRFFYFSTTGWMMWNWLVSALASRATLILYDGNPFHPGPEVLWDMAAADGITVFGTGAKYIDACRNAGIEPGRTHDLSALRCICSTGSPLLPESFEYVYNSIKRDVQLASISGGTDIVSCFVLGCPILPVWTGEIQCAGLGMKVEIFDDDGRPLTGKPGELVCTAPAPSMPVRFWGDDDGSRYRSAYFEHFPGVWRHGDLVERTENGGFVISGRSDATLNPGGVRIGTAEIYGQVAQIPEVVESIVVGQDWAGDQRIILFVILNPGRELDDDLIKEIRYRIRSNTTPRHTPQMILQVDDIPRTRSGKISEIAVRNLINGRPVKNTGALANPAALELYRDIPELR
ncbi:MAG: acetoacetate--CoA ligase [bacterium]|nr:acetoacetate--CoA ligase [bacterium]